MVAFGFQVYNCPADRFAGIGFMAYRRKNKMAALNATSEGRLRAAFVIGVPSDVRTDRKSLFAGRSSKRDPIQTSCTAQIKNSTLTARTAKSNIAMIGLRSNAAQHRTL